MNWDDSLDPAAITVDEVLSGKRDVLLVMHDEGHGGWQFYDGRDVTGRKPVVLPKAEFLLLDPTLGEVTDLPVGWLARRSARGRPWSREPIPPEAPL